MEVNCCYRNWQEQSVPFAFVGIKGDDLIQKIISGQTEKPELSQQYIYNESNTIGFL